MYSCNICNYNSNLKSNYNRHLRSNKHMAKSSNLGVCNTNATQCNTNVTQCNTNVTQTVTQCNTNVTQNVTQEKYICKYCNNSFKSHPSYYRHMKHYCKENKKENKLSFKDRQDLIEFLKNEFFDELSIVPINKDTNIKTKTNNNISNSNSNNSITNNNSNNSITNNNNNNNNTTTTTNTTNITIKNFGCENTSHLTDEFKYKMIHSPYEMMKPLIRAIHLDPRVPENRNIVVENIKEKRVMVFENGEWQYKELDYILGDMVDAKYYLVDVFYSEKKENQKEEFNKNVSYVQDERYIKFRKEYDDMDENLINKLKTDCKNTLYVIRKDLKKKKIKET
jgi:hypothetical protein